MQRLKCMILKLLSGKMKTFDHLCQCWCSSSRNPLNSWCTNSLASRFHRRNSTKISIFLNESTKFNQKKKKTRRKRNDSSNVEGKLSGTHAELFARCGVEELVTPQYGAELNFPWNNTAVLGDNKFLLTDVDGNLGTTITKASMPFDTRSKYPYFCIIYVLIEHNFL